jgi:hypothetical protein
MTRLFAMGTRTMDHAHVMNSCDAKAQDVGLTALTPIERVVFLVSHANFEIELGGISSFYYNNAGDHAMETVAALKAIGARKAASALRAANALFPNETPPTDRKERYDALQLLAVEDGFAKFDSRFAGENPDVFSRLCSYIDDHKADLTEHQGSAAAKKAAIKRPTPKGKRSTKRR